ncbi:MAG: hypothetical protein EOO36_21330 [Cytophagaceae bacterium]|nr:MAG: hypothetical protein EOO36_21330 [Cytophagaceae bacterium]
MRTATRRYLLASLLLSSVCFTACSSKEEAPTPDPAATFDFTRYIDFVVPAPGGGTTHSGGGVVHAPEITWRR